MKTTELAGAVCALILTACATQTAAHKEILPLAGSEWGTNIDGQFIRFDEPGRVSNGAEIQGWVMGNGGCNRFRGEYSLRGSALYISPLMSTKMACSKLPQEQEFFALLAKTKQAEITHLSLVLKDEAGNILATLKRQDWD